MFSARISDINEAMRLPLRTIVPAVSAHVDAHRLVVRCHQTDLLRCPPLLAAVCHWMRELEERGNSVTC